MGRKLNFGIMGRKVMDPEQGEVSSPFLKKAMDGNDLVKKIRAGKK
jgi:hypothetical protein